MHRPNVVISMLNSHLYKIGYSKNGVSFRADNSSGQNKNLFLVAYLAWCVITGLNKVIKFMMQVPGQCRCILDASFTHINRKYKRPDCHCIRYLANGANNLAVLFH